MAKVGSSCLFQIPGQKKPKRRSDIDRGENETRKESIVLGSYQIKCIPNAKCVYPEDICSCDFRYYKATNGSCVGQKGLGEKCSASEQCDKFQFLSCVSGSCSCDRGHRYDTKNEKCVASVGTECNVINYRDINEVHFFQHECPEDAHCHRNGSADSGRGICKCDPGFRVTLDKSCGKVYGDRCSDEDRCSDVQFICRSGTCRCKYPLHQAYDEVSKRCISTSGGPCDVPKLVANATSDGDEDNEPGIGCTDNSVCHENSPFNYCRCLPGFIETNEGKCVKAFGSRCQMDEECDPLPQLACINNACNCPDKLQSYDDKHRTCVSLAGGRCRKENNGTIPSCTGSAYCVKNSGHLEYGRCICARGTYTTVNRTCTKGQ